MTNKVESITILAKTWFDKTYGNSYFTATVYVNNDRAFDIPFTYGYGSMYEQVAFEQLVEKGYLKPLDNKSSCYGWYPPSLHCRENGIKLISEIVTVARKKDL